MAQHPFYGVRRATDPLMSGARAAGAANQGVDVASSPFFRHWSRPEREVGYLTCLPG